MRRTFTETKQEGNQGMDVPTKSFGTATIMDANPPANSLADQPKSNSDWMLTIHEKILNTAEAGTSLRDEKFIYQPVNITDEQQIVLLTKMGYAPAPNHHLVDQNKGMIVLKIPIDLYGAQYKIEARQATMRAKGKSLPQNPHSDTSVDDKGTQYTESRGIHEVLAQMPENKESLEEQILEQFPNLNRDFDQ